MKLSVRRGGLTREGFRPRFRVDVGVTDRRLYLNLTSLHFFFSGRGTEVPSGIKLTLVVGGFIICLTSRDSRGCLRSS